MTFLAKEFFRDLVEENVTTEEFMVADRQIRKNNKFFPVMADILTAVREYRDEVYAEQSRQRQWVRDNEWRKNYPETLTAYEAELLGVRREAIESSAEQGFITKAKLDQMIKKCVKQISDN